MIIDSVLLLLAGLVCGFLNVMAGGGSLLSVPLMIFLGIPGAVANGTNRIAILAQNATAVVTFYKKGFSDIKLSLSLAVCTLPGAIAGAYFASGIDAENFNQLLAVIMVVVMVVMWFGDNKKTSVEPQPITAKRLIIGHILMVFAGFWGGFIQIGVGFILLPILHRVMGFDLVRSNMHKVFLVFAYTIAALLIFSSQLQLAWVAGISLAIGNSIGGWYAANHQIEKGAGAIKWILNSVLIVFIIKLLFF